jgi:phosphate ABC transporter phosphate-binding protein
MVAVIVLILVVVVVGAGLATNWFHPMPSSNSKPSSQFPVCAPGAAPVTISGAGSSFVYPMANFWGVQYNQLTGCAQFSENPVGSGAGITQLTNKLVNIGCSDAPLSPTQRAGFSGSTVLHVPWALGAVSVEYNTGVAGIGLNFSAQVVSDIFLQKITNWNDPAIKALNPNSALPNLAIVPVHRSDGSGTTFVFTSWLFASSQDWRNSHLGHNLTVSWPTSGELAESGSQAVTSTVQTTAGAIGYAELNYAKTGGTHVTYGAIQDPAGQFILPNPTNTAAAAQAIAPTLPAGSADWANVTIINQPNGAYPIATFTYALVYEDLGKAYASSLSQGNAQWVVHFLWWAVNATGGQSYASGLFFVPLPSAIVSADQASIKAMVYNGASFTTP